MSLMSKSTAAYIAGFVDGEGYLGLIKDSRKINNRRDDSYTAVLKIANTDKNIIYWFKQSFGGTINFRKMKGNQKDAYCWTMSGLNLMPFLERIIPYLKIKKKQAELIRLFRKTINPSSYEFITRSAKNGGKFVSKTTKPEVIEKRKILYNQIKELNRRGILHAERLTEITRKGSDSPTIRE